MIESLTVTLRDSGIDGGNEPTVNARDLHRVLEVGRDFSTWIKGRIREGHLVEGADYVVVRGGSSDIRPMPTHLDHGNPPKARWSGTFTRTLSDEIGDERPVLPKIGKNGVDGLDEDWVPPALNRAGYVEEINDFPENRINSKNVFTDSGEKPRSAGGRPTVDYHLTLNTAKELSMMEGNEKGQQARRYFINCESELKRVMSALLTPPKAFERWDAARECSFTPEQVFRLTRDDCPVVVRALANELAKQQQFMYAMELRIAQLKPHTRALRFNNSGNLLKPPKD